MRQTPNRENAMQNKIIEAISPFVSGTKTMTRVSPDNRVDPTAIVIEFDDGTDERIDIASSRPAEFMDWFNQASGWWHQVVWNDTWNWPTTPRRRWPQRAVAVAAGVHDRCEGLTPAEFVRIVVGPKTVNHSNHRPISTKGGVTSGARFVSLWHFPSLLDSVRRRRRFSRSRTRGRNRGKTVQWPRKTAMPHRVRLQTRWDGEWVIRRDRRPRASEPE